jgi:hypothetical protein
MDKDNFSFTIGDNSFVMINGELTIDGSVHHPSMWADIYVLARRVAADNHCFVLKEGDLPPVIIDQ